jgi:hypothetical protein
LLARELKANISEIFAGDQQVPNAEGAEAGAAHKSDKGREFVKILSSHAFAWGMSLSLS